MCLFLQKAYKQIDNYYINQIFSERMKKRFVLLLACLLAGIGLAIGGGLYWLGVAATVLTLVGLEFLRYVFKYIGIGLKVSKLIFTIDDIGKVKQILNDLNASGYHIVTYTLKEEKEDLIRVTMLVKSLESSNDENHLLMLIQKMPDVMLEKFE